MTQPSTIFITGGTGFIGAHVVAQTLKAGHRALLSVRREAQIPQLRSRLAAAGVSPELELEHPSQLSFAILPDITDQDSLRSALLSNPHHPVDFVFHIASPMPGKGTDFSTDYARPAVAGTTALLAAAASIPSIKRVIIVSSALALMPLGGLSTPGLRVTEGANPSLSVPAIDDDEGWDGIFRPLGDGAHGAKYSASKILAHRATLTWAQEHKPKFKLVTLHPAFVLGRDLAQAADKEQGMATVNGGFVASLKAAEKKPHIPSSFVDVRDVALAHLRSIDAKLGEEGGGVTEYLLESKPGVTWKDVVGFVKDKYPQVDVKLTGPFDEPFSSDTSRAEKDLGIKWHGMQEIVGSVLDQQIALGKL
ncbi:hypothetical protein QBC46DRAFT_462956 [Diplogelasinospora grovesii]|uniref:NAD-dependent epimerase/dehydratase domain-containing protein n=1 Tax=Diplogelasinospora grovesii TaxID=303347 RepID=A0AAN6MVM7_9PEZI|nr:hypothetical protein QBC46DRAFT_462956 [Diplogelasinospora grovesii]